MQNMKKKPNISILNRIDIFLIKEVVTERPLNNLHTIRYKWSFFQALRNENKKYINDITNFKFQYKLYVAKLKIMNTYHYRKLTKKTLNKKINKENNMFPKFMILRQKNIQLYIWNTLITNN